MALSGSERARMRKPSFLAFCGALLAAAAIGLSAYAAHGVADAVVQSRLLTAAVFAFGHGVVLVILGPMTARRLERLALYALLLAVLLFSGSLVGSAMLQWPTRLAPVGGIVSMAAWLVLALNALRR